MERGAGGTAGYGAREQGKAETPQKCEKKCPPYVGREGEVRQIMLLASVLWLRSSHVLTDCV